MPVNFGIEERRILDLFKQNKTFIFEGQKYTIIFSGKPTCSKGEPKTDIYVRADSYTYKREFKISFKKANADFLENKINSERAAQLFGMNWADIIRNSTEQLKDSFLDKKLIYKKSFGRTEEGAITLGWKFELLNVESGQLSDKMKLTKKQVIDVYAGTNLDEDKRNAYVNGKIIRNSGIANYILFENAPIKTLQDAIDNLIAIDVYVKGNPNIYFACKALNYRTYAEKYDGDRPLSVYVNWFINKNNKLDNKICFDTPLMQGGNIVADKLLNALKSLNIKTTKDINNKNVENMDCVFDD